MLKSFFNKIFEETLFLIVAVFVIVFSFLIKKPDFCSADYGVIAFLCVLMLISLGLEKEHFLDKIAVTVIDQNHSERKIGAAMMITTAVIAMFVTNDVALITVVPITLIIARKGDFDPFRIIVIETAAANFGGSLTPMGNPQNIFLYHYYKFEPLQFIRAMSPFFLICIAISIMVIFRLSDRKIDFEDEEVEIQNKRKVMIYLSLLLLTLLTVFRLIDIETTFFVTIVTVLVIDGKLFLNLDYFLLATFLLFFVMIDQISAVEQVREIASDLVGSKINTMVTASLLSQAISNVPAAILTAPFTKEGQTLVTGVSIGGFGTLIASLANLISYKFYSNQYQDRRMKNNYLIYFHKVNILYLCILLLLLR